jgi:curved DNA binding protein
MEKKVQKKKVEEEVEEEEVEEVEEEDEDEVGEDFAKDPRAYSLWVDAGKIADAALLHVLSLVKPNAVIYDICLSGDSFIRNELAKVYNKKKYSKSIAFPTSISVNEVCGHYAPTLEEIDENHKTIAEGDVVKVDLGVQIHGFAAVAAHTVVAGDSKVTGRNADVVLAAYHAVQASLRQFNVKSNNNDDITNTIKTVTDAYHVNPIEGVLSHKMRRDVVDGFETIINKKTPDQKVDIRDFQHGDVFGLDIIVSSGEGKPKETSVRTTIYKRALETTYKLKSDASRKLLSVVEHNFFNFPFSLNSFDNEENLTTTKSIENLKQVAKIGLTECVNHELFYPHPVLAEKKGEVVAQFKYTIAVRNEGPLVLCGSLMDTSRYTSEYKVEDQGVVALLAKDVDAYLPNSKKLVKVEKPKKDNKAKKAKKLAAKEKKAEEKK